MRMLQNLLPFLLKNTDDFLKKLFSHYFSKFIENCNITTSFVGPKTSSTCPTFCLFSKYTPTLNIGTWELSCTLTIAKFSHACTKVPTASIKRLLKNL